MIDVLMRLEPRPMEAGIRELTDGEVSFYHANGWVFLPRLLEPSFCERMAELWLQDGAERDLASLQRRTGFAGSPPPSQLQRVATDPVLGRNVYRLMNLQRLGDSLAGVRLRLQSVLSKTQGPTPVNFHQDSCEHGVDRGGELQVWIALRRALPEMGTMQFYSGSHREGPLGSCADEASRGLDVLHHDLLRRHPGIADLYELTAPMRYEAGDASVHHGFMIHGSRPNVTSEVRLSYVCTFAPSDARYWDSHLSGPTGARRTTPDETDFPVTYPPRA